MTKNLITILLVVVVGLGLAFVAGCESDAQTGALIEGTLIGAGVGAAGGYMIGNEQDKKK
jgi:hypothetical protein